MGIRTGAGFTRAAEAQPVVLVGTDGAPTGLTSTQNTYTLASNAAINSGANTTPVTGIVGGSYIWNAVGTFAGATLKLQSLAADGATWLDITGASLTANGSLGVVLGNNAAVRIAATGGSATGISSSLS